MLTSEYWAGGWTANGRVVHVIRPNAKSLRKLYLDGNGGRREQLVVSCGWTPIPVAEHIATCGLHPTVCIIAGSISKKFRACRLADKEFKTMPWWWWKLTQLNGSDSLPHSHQPREPRLELCASGVLVARELQRKTWKGNGFASYTHLLSVEKQLQS